MKTDETNRMIMTYDKNEIPVTFFETIKEMGRFERSGII